MQFPYRALGICLAATALFTAIMTTGVAYADRGPKAACAGRLCFSNTEGTKSCFTRSRKEQVSRCFIKRAAAHFGQPRQQALAIAFRESRYDYSVTNSSSGAAGLYQFMPSTWQSTPYRKHSAYSPKWASLGAMWMWSKGGYGHWSL